MNNAALAECPSTDSSESHSHSPLLVSRGDGRFVLSIILLGGILVLAITLRLQQLLDVSFWFDEACSWRMGQFSWSDLGDAVSRDAHPPAFYILLKGWQTLCGVSVSSARFLAVTCGMLSIAAAGGLAFQMSPESEHPKRCLNGLFSFVPLAVFLFAVHPGQVVSSQQCRPYQAGVCLLLLAAMFLLQAMRVPSSIYRWSAFLCCSLLLSLTHYYGLFSLVALFLFAFHETLFAGTRSNRAEETRHRLVGLTVCGMGIQACWLPWIPTFQQQCARMQSQTWLPPLTQDQALRLASKYLMGENDLPAEVGWGVVLLLGILSVLLSCRCGTSGRLLSFCIVIPPLIATGYSLFVHNILESRYLVFSQCFLLIAIAMLIPTIPRPSVRNGCLIVLVLVSCLLSRRQCIQRNWDAEHNGLVQAMKLVDQFRQGDEPLLIGSPFLFPTACALLQNHSHPVLQYQGDHRHDVLAGPPLLASDYEPFEGIIAASPQVLWTIDVEHWNGERTAVAVPLKYVPTLQKRFVESYGMPMDILVREYRLPLHASPVIGDGEK